MKVNFNVNSQDILIILNESEFPNKIAEDFFDNPIKATSLEAQAHFFLNSSKIFFNNSHQLDGGIQLVLPEENGDSYLINLLPEGVNYLRLHKQCSSRYPNGSKLMMTIK